MQAQTMPQGRTLGHPGLRQGRMKAGGGRTNDDLRRLDMARGPFSLAKENVAARRATARRLPTNTQRRRHIIWNIRTTLRRGRGAPFHRRAANAGVAPARSAACLPWRTTPFGGAARLDANYAALPTPKERDGRTPLPRMLPATH